VRLRTHGGNLWELTRQQGFRTEEILDFSVDLNPFGFPQETASVITRHLEDIRFYPDPDAWELRQAIAAHHRLPADRILPGNGTAELIALLAQWRPIKKALVVIPAFSEYEWALERTGAETLFVPTVEADRFRLKLAPERWQELLQGTDVVFLCNPNNPTGVLFPQQEVLQVARWCEAAGAVLVVDEAFMEFVEDPEGSSVVSETLRQGNLVVLRSLTKFFSVPGLRIGYLVASPSLIAGVRAFQQPWPLNTFALAVGSRLFKETEYIARSKRATAQLRGAFQRSLSAIPELRCFESATNFILCRVEAPDCTSAELCARLAAKGILVRNCDNFSGLEPGRFIRLAVRSQDDNSRLVEELAGIFAHAG